MTLCTHITTMYKTCYNILSGYDFRTWSNNRTNRKETTYLYATKTLYLIRK